MRFILSLCLMAVTLAGSAQDKGTLSLFIYPTPETVLVNGEVLKYTNTLHLEPGVHNVQAWYPQKKLLDTNIVLTAGDTIRFFHRFPEKESFSRYMAATVERKRMLHKKYTVPVVATAVSGGALAYTIIRGRQLEQEAQDRYYEYQYAGFDLEESRQSFEEAQDRYRKYYYAQYVEYAALAVSSYFLYKGLQWLRRNPAPVLEEDRNPLQLEQVGFVPNMGPTRGFGLGLTLSFK